MVTSRNVEEVVIFLKKQLQRTMTEDYEKVKIRFQLKSAPRTLPYVVAQISEYRQLLIQSIHVCAVKFSEVAASVVHALMEFLGESNNPAAVDVIAFVRCVSPFEFVLDVMLTGR